MRLSTIRVHFYMKHNSTTIVPIYIQRTGEHMQLDIDMSQFNSTLNGSNIQSLLYHIFLKYGLAFQSGNLQSTGYYQSTLGISDMQVRKRNCIVMRYVISTKEELTELIAQRNVNVPSRTFHKNIGKFSGHSEINFEDNYYTTFYEVSPNYYETPKKGSIVQTALSTLKDGINYLVSTKKKEQV